MTKKIATSVAIGLLAAGCASGISNVNPNPEKSLQKTPAQFAYDHEGNRAPGKGTWIEKVELFYGGSLYAPTVRPAD